MESNSGSREQGEGTLEDLMRERIRATIETIVDEELEAALGAGHHRSGSARFELATGTASAREP
jgi:transposase-like protein